MKSISSTRTRLLLSVASICAVAAPAAAQQSGASATGLSLSEYTITAHNSGPEFALDTAHAGTLTGSERINPGDVIDSPHITIRDPYTHQDAYDPENITGVGQIITDQGGGFIGTCTGTLINPRTIIFAAHCVNGAAATSYGANSGGTAVGIGFETNTRANASGQVDELVRWLLGGTDGAGQFQTNTAQSFYNLSQVFWDPRSRQGASCTSATSCFLEADIATGVLDTPAKDIPTWALLFSPLDVPASIDPATGTGYHVTVTGYGAYGVGASGAAASGNYRRRAAENMIGALTSLAMRDAFLFGSGSNRVQQLYFLDFDDPNRGTSTGNTRDFNGFRDNALEREGLTGPGDSGGPLILDQHFDKPVVIGVLSGGSTFYTGQTGGSYGTQSFYQPLFLYWDWIVANNPYHYVTAKAGNYDWNNGQAWLTELDPNYQIIVDGQLVNGLPTHLGGANSGTGQDFGQMCYQTPANAPKLIFNECYDVAKGEWVNNVPNVTPTNGGEGTVDSNLSAISYIGRSGDELTPSDTAHAGNYSDTPVGTPTLANGLPGATGFVPNNYDGDRENGVIASYYDVTLRNTGNITLNQATTVDRFAIMGATSQLTIGAQGSLTSLMEIVQGTGTIVNNGVLSSPGDYLILSGLLTGNGRINAPFTTSVLGSFAPGTIGTTGTLTFNGGLVMSSATNYLVDLGTNGVSDRIAVVGADNQALIDGTLVVTFGTGSKKNGNKYTILTAEGGVVGEFSEVSNINTMLRSVLSYTNNAVTLEIVADKFTDVLESSNPTVNTWASILDQNRDGSAAWNVLYDTLDSQDLSVIEATLASWSPAAVATATNLGLATVTGTTNFLSARMDSIGNNTGGGSLARYGRPVEVAALSMNSFGANAIATDTSAPLIQEDALPDTMSGFIAGGYLKGDSASMVAGARDKYDGFFVGAGLEFAVGNSDMIGVAFHYTDIKGTASFGGQRATGVSFQGSVYGKVKLGGRVQLDGQVNGGSLVTKTQRVATLGGTNYTLRSDDSAFIFNTELGLGFDLGNDSIEVTPRVAARGTWISFGDINEVGGPMGLRINRDGYESIQGRAGLKVAGKGKGLRPFVSGHYVHEFNDRDTFLVGNLIGATGPGAAFNLYAQDKDWFEVSGGIGISTDRVDLSVAADSTLDRSDLSAQSYRATVKFRF